MRRIVAIAVAALLAAVLAVMGTGAGSDGSGSPRFEVELDNAFGLIAGGDLKIAGVRAGKITGIALDERTLRAVVGFEITQDGFGSLRRDVRCDVKPQSLIGEYYLDCQPGTARELLAEGSRIPVEKTTSTIAPDLVNDVMRRPYRERLSIILGELGAAAAGNGGALNAAIRRASPALRETNRVLATLARQNGILADLVRDADTVIGDLAGNREDVGRFVSEARDTAAASASRREAIAAGFRRLPAFLDRLQPAMEALGATAREQTPALRDLRRSAGELQELFDRLGPFAEASLPATKALGRAGDTGKALAERARPVIAALRKPAAGTPELGTNLAMVLEHLDDPAHAVEADPRAARATGRPAPTGYTGLEALLTYVYDQNMATNTYDGSTHVLKIAAQESVCGNYADAATVKASPDLQARCTAALGPNQPGVTFPDPTIDDAPEADARRRARRKRIDGDGRPLPPVEAPAPPAAMTPEPSAPVEVPATPAPDRPKPAITLPQIQLPQLPGITRPGGRDDDTDPQDAAALLDYLLRP